MEKNKQKKRKKRIGVEGSTRIPLRHKNKIQLPKIVRKKDLTPDIKIENKTETTLSWREKVILDQSTRKMFRKSTSKKAVIAIMHKPLPMHFKDFKKKNHAGVVICHNDGGDPYNMALLQDELPPKFNMEQTRHYLLELDFDLTTMSSKQILRWLINKARNGGSDFEISDEHYKIVEKLYLSDKFLDYYFGKGKEVKFVLKNMCEPGPSPNLNKLVELFLRRIGGFNNLLRVEEENKTVKNRFWTYKKSYTAHLYNYLCKNKVEDTLLPPNLNMMPSRSPTFSRIKGELGEGLESFQYLSYGFDYYEFATNKDMPEMDLETHNVSTYGLVDEDENPVPHSVQAHLLCKLCKRVNFVQVPLIRQREPEDGIWKSAKDSLKENIMKIIDKLHCGYCGAMLKNYAVFLYTTFSPVNMIAKIMDENVGTLLDELGSIGYLDAIHLTPDQLQQVITVDLSLLRSILSRLNIVSIDLMPGMSRRQLKIIENVFPQFNLIIKPSMNVPNSYYQNVFQVLWKIILTTNAADELILYYGEIIMPYVETNVYHLIPVLNNKHILDIKEGKFGDGEPCRLSDFDPKDKRGNLILMDHNVLNYSPTEIMEFMQKCASKQLIIIIPTNNINFDGRGTLSEEQGDWMISDNKLIILKNGFNHPDYYDAVNARFWSEGDIFSFNHLTMLIKTKYEFADYKVREVILNISYETDNLERPKRPVFSKGRVLKIPEIKINSVAGMLGLSLTTIKEITVNEKLLKNLCVRNVMGDMTMSELLEYGMGLAYSKYSVKDYSYSVMDVTSDEVRDHCLVAYVLGYRKKLHFKVGLYTNPVKRTISSLAVDMITSFVQTIYSYTFSQLFEGTGIDYTSINTRKWIMDSSETIHKYLYDPLWDKIEVDMNQALTEKLVKYDAYDVDSANVQMCDCHVDFEDMEIAVHGEQCLCCFVFKREKGTNLCKACVKKSHRLKCGHISSCLEDHLFDTTKPGVTECECCGIKYNGPFCKVCNVIGVNLNQGHYDTVKLTAGEKVIDVEPEEDLIVETGRKDKDDIGVTDEEEGIIEAPKEPSIKVKPYYLNLEGIDMDLALLTTDCKNNLGEEYTAMLLQGKLKAWMNESIRLPTKRTGLLYVSELKFVNMGKNEINTANLTDFDVEDIESTDDLCAYQAMRAIFGGLVTESLVRRTLGEVANLSNHQLIELAKVLGVNLIVITDPISLIQRSISDNDEYGVIIHASVIGRPIQHWYPGYVQQVGPVNGYISGTLGASITACKDEYVKLNYGPHIYNMDKIPTSLKMKVELEIYKSHQLIIRQVRENYFIPKMIIKNREVWISNNKLESNAIRDGYIHTMINEKYKEEAELFCSTDPSALKNRMISEGYDKMSDSLESLDENIRNKLRDAIKNVLTFRFSKYSAYDKIAFKSHVKVTITNVNKDLATVQGLDPRTKTFDVIVIRKPAGEANVIREVIKQNKTFYITPIVGQQGRIVCTILQPKLSIGSAYRLIMATLTSSCEVEHIKQLYESSKCIDGVPGSGKTTYITDNADSATTIIAMTSGAVSNLNMAFETKRAISVEQAMINKVKTKKLFIDEASMIELSSLAIMLTSNVKELTILGDSKQIGFVDMSSTSGIRIESNIMGMHKNVEKWNHTYRLSQTLTRELAVIEPNLRTKSEKEGVVEMYYNDEFNIHFVAQLINSIKPDVILVFYNDMYEKLNDNLTGMFNVQKVHAHQGWEYDKVLVIQGTIGIKRGNIHLDNNYCYSAATRAISELHWLSIGCFDHESPLSVRISSTVTGGTFNAMENRYALDVNLVQLISTGTGIERLNKEHLLKLKGRQLSLPRKLHKGECERIVEYLNSYKKLKFMVIRSEDNNYNNLIVGKKFGLTIIAIRVQNYSMNIIKGENHLLNTEYSDWFTKLIMKIYNNDFRGEDEPVLSAMPITLDYDDEFDEPSPSSEQSEYDPMLRLEENGKMICKCGYASTIDDIDTSKMHEIKTKVSISLFSKLRIINHLTMRNQAHGKGLEINLTGSVINLRSVAGCSTCCGIIIYINNELRCVVDKGYTTVLMRRIYVTKKIDIILRNVLYWLDLSLPRELDQELGFEFLYELPIPKIFTQNFVSMGIVLERLSYLVNEGKNAMCKLIGLEGHNYWQSCDRGNKQYVNEVNAMLLANSETVDDSHIKKLPHMDLTRTVLKVKNKNKFVILKSNGEFLTTEEPEKDLVDFQIESWLELLKTRLFQFTAKILQPNMEIPIAGFQMQGLMLTLNKHAELDTAVHHYLKRKTGSLFLQRHKPIENVVYITARQSELYSKYIKMESVNVPINVSGVFQMSEGFDSLISQLHLHFLRYRFDKNESLLNCTTFPANAIVNSMWNVYSMPINEDNLKWQYQSNIMDAKAALEKVRQVIKPDGETYNRATEEKKKELSKLHNSATEQLRGKDVFYSNGKHKTMTMATKMNMGIHLCAFSLNEVLRMIDDTDIDIVYGIIPNINASNTNMFYSIRYHSAKKKVIIYDGARETYDINNMTMQQLTRDEIISTPKYNWIVTIEGGLLGHLNVILNRRPKDVVPNPFVSPIEDMYSDSNVSFSFPVFKPVIAGLLTKQPIIEWQKCTASKKMYKLLSLRMLKPGTTFDELLSYGRTLLHASYYGYEGSWSAINDTTTVVVNTCILVYVQAKRVDAGMQELLRRYDEYKFNSEQGMDLIKLMRYEDRFGFILNVLSKVTTAIGLGTTVEDIQNCLLHISKMSTYARSNIMDDWVTNFSKMQLKMEIYDRAIYKRGNNSGMLWPQRKLQENYDFQRFETIIPKRNLKESNVIIQDKKMDRTEQTSTITPTWEPEQEQTSQSHGGHEEDSKTEILGVALGTIGEVAFVMRTLKALMINPKYRISIILPDDMMDRIKIPESWIIKKLGFDFMGMCEQMTECFEKFNIEGINQVARNLAIATLDYMVDKIEFSDIVVGTAGYPIPIVIAKALQKKTILSNGFPWFINEDLPCAFLPLPFKGNLFNMVSYRLLDVGINNMYKVVAGKIEEKLGRTLEPIATYLRDVDIEVISTHPWLLGKLANKLPRHVINIKSNAANLLYEDQQLSCMKANNYVLIGFSSIVRSDLLTVVKKSIEALLVLGYRICMIRGKLFDGVDECLIKVNGEMINVAEDLVSDCIISLKFHNYNSIINNCKFIISHSSEAMVNLAIDSKTPIIATSTYAEQILYARLIGEKGIGYSFEGEKDIVLKINQMHANFDNFKRRLSSVEKWNQNLEEACLQLENVLSTGTKTYINISRLTWTSKTRLEEEQEKYKSITLKTVDEYITIEKPEESSAVLSKDMTKILNLRHVSSIENTYNQGKIVDISNIKCQTTYVPLTSKGCVKDCIEEFCKSAVYNIRWDLLYNQYNIETDFMSVDSIKHILNLLGISFIIIEGRKGIKCEFEWTGQIICLEIIDTDKLQMDDEMKTQITFARHCTLCSVSSYEELDRYDANGDRSKWFEPDMSHGSVYTKFPGANREIADVISTAPNVVSLVLAGILNKEEDLIPMELYYQVTNRAKKTELTERMSLTNLFFIMQRSMDNVIDSVLAHQGKGWRIVTNQEVFEMGNTYLVSTVKGWIRTVCIMLRDSMYLYNGRSVREFTGTIIPLRANIVNSDAPIVSVKIKPTSKSYAINKVTQEFLRKENINVKIAKEKCIIDKLFVYNYDNRVHHLSKAKEIFESVDYDNIKFLGEEVNEEVYKKLIRKPSSLRYIYNYGVIKMAIEATDIPVLMENWLDENNWIKLSMSTYENGYWQNANENIQSFWNDVTVMRGNTFVYLHDSIFSYIFEPEVISVFSFLSRYSYDLQLWHQVIANLEEPYILDNHVLVKYVPINAESWDVSMECYTGKMVDYVSNDSQTVIDYRNVCTVEFHVITKFPEEVVEVPEIRGGADELWDEKTETAKYKHTRFTMHDEQVRQSDEVLEAKFEKLKEKPIETTAMLNMKLEEVEYVTIDEDGEWYARDFLPKLNLSKGSSYVYKGMVLEPCIPAEVMDLFTIQDLTDFVNIVKPLNNIRIRSTEIPGRVKTFKKAMLAKYPESARPVFTKMIYMTQNALASRMGAVVKVVKERLNVTEEVNNFIKAYCVGNISNQINKFKSDGNILTFNDQKIKEWLLIRPEGLIIAEELLTILKEGWQLHPLNKVKVHAKLESLLKDEPVKSYKEQQVRLIVWQSKGLCAIFSHIFIEAKRRLKEILRPDVLYADGLTLEQINNKMMTIRHVNRFFSDDLKKQDSRTTHDLINVEFAIYELLGVDRTVLEIWRRIHNNWRYKGKRFSGELDAMRLTGQATTALGNALVNLITHSNLVLRNFDEIKFIMILGDDNLMAVSSFLDLRKLKRRMIEKYNMINKATSDENFGNFCSLITYYDEQGGIQAGPDYVRLCRRYEVPNGLHEAVNTLSERALSYAGLIGGTKELLEFYNKNQVEPVKLVYDPFLAIKATSYKYEITTEAVASYYNKLISMINEPKIYYQTIQAFVAND